MDQPTITGRVIEWLPDIGAGGIVVFVVFLVLTGRLVPGRERDAWREAFFEEQRQKRDLIDGLGGAAKDFLRAIPDAIEERDR